MTWILQPVLPLWLVVLACMALLGAVAWGAFILKRRNIPRGWILRLVLLRCLAVVVMALILLRPGYMTERTAREPPERIIVVDKSASMSLTDTPGGKTRLANALQRLGNPPLGDDWLSATRNHWFVFDNHTLALNDAAELDTLEADGADTAIGVALEEAWNLYRWSLEEPEGIERVAPRVLLVSDGRDRGRLNALDTARSLGLTVDVLAPETEFASDEVRCEIADVQHPRRILLGSELRMQVALRQSGLDGRPLRLLLSSEDGPLQTHEIVFRPQQTEQRLTMTLRPDAIGMQTYRLSVVSDDETLADTLAMATRDVVVRVESHYHEVLLLEPEWRWEFRYLRRVLEDDPSFAFSGFLSRGSGLYIQFGEPRRRVNLGGFPRTAAELEGFDTLLLGDVHPDRMPPQLLDACHELVVQRGKSLVVIAGPNIAVWGRHPRLASLLPVELYPSSSGAVEGPVPVQISLEGQSSPFFYAPPGRGSLRGWKQLPALDQIYAPVRKKPAATVLLETPAHANEFGPLIVAAVQPVGRGQVLFIATDTLWKWQMRGQSDPEGNTPYNVFWQQAMRALRPERLSSSSVDLWLQPDRTRNQAGQTIAVYAHAESARAGRDMRIEGRLKLPDQRELPLIFKRHETDPGRFVCQFEASNAGRYEIYAQAVMGSRPAGEAVTTVEVDALPAEDDPAPPNYGFLENLAAGTGGVRLNDDTAARALPSEGEDKVVTRTQRIDPWSRLWLLVALAVLLGFDWVLRLMRGYS